MNQVISDVSDVNTVFKIVKINNCNLITVAFCDANMYKDRLVAFLAS